MNLWLLVVAISFASPTPSVWPGMYFAGFFETRAECQKARTIFTEEKVRADAARHSAKMKDWNSWCLSIVRDTEI